MEEKDLKHLIQKYLNRECTEDEKIYLESWYAQLNESEKAGLPDAALLKSSGKVKKTVFRRIGKEATGKRLPLRMLAAGIAALAVIVGGMFYYFSDTLKEPMVADVAPGSNKAFLILGDGTAVNLDSVDNGNIGLQSGSSIVKQNGGAVVYNAANGKQSASRFVAYNTLKVPLGGQYHLTLSDGTKVWLNAGSSLRFPASFASLSDRRVYLEGEAYFEVAHDPAHPFYVRTEKQQVQVLGTHFDIEAYKDTKVSKTTLLQGSLKVVSAISQDSCLLVPGKQAVLTEKMRVVDADIDAVVDWKDGYFIFNNESVTDILTKVARWYNVKVVYDREVEGIHLDGIISKNTPLSEVLSLLSATRKVSFEIRGNDLHVVQ